MCGKMRREVKVDFAGVSNCCLVAVSWPSASSELNKTVNVIKVETETGQRHFFSVGSRINSTDISLKINGQFGRLLHLKDGERVFATPLEYNIPSVKTAHVHCISEEDWEILESNAEVVANSLIHQIRVVYPGLLFPFWVSKSLSINLVIEKLDPPVEIGILDTFSEIHVPAVVATSTTKAFSLKSCSSQLRIHPITVLPSVKLTSSTNLLLYNVAHAFVYKSSLSKSADEEQDDDVQEDSSFVAKIVYFEDETEQQQSSTLLVLKIFFIENIIDSYQDLADLFPRLNPPCLFIHPKLFSNSSIKAKSFVSIEQVPPSTFNIDSPEYSSIPFLSTKESDSSIYFQTFADLFDKTRWFLHASLGLTTDHHGMYGPTFGLMLVTGKNGSGKTSFAENVAKSFENFPHFLHWENISCAKLKGKKSETVQKEFDRVIKRAVSLIPSILILDDLDILCPAERPDQPNAQEEFLNYRLCEVIFEAVMSLERKQIAVVCTSKSTNSLHSYWQGREGRHVFHHCVHIPPPNQVERLGIFRACLRRYQSRTETGMLSCNRTTASTCTAHPTVKSDGTLVVSKVGLCTEEEEGSDGNDDDRNVPVPLTNTCHSLQYNMTDTMQTALFNLHDEFASPNTIHNIAKKYVLYQAKENFAILSEEEKDEAFQSIIQDEIKSRETNVKKNKILKTITWSNIGGLSKVKQELTKILQWPIKYSKLFDKSPIKMPSGILLYGFPGTGKTLLGLSMPSVVTNAKFLHIKGPELLSKYIGASEQNVQDLFRKAKDSSPCILFFDEFDSLVPRRGHDSTGVTDRVVNQFLAEMDGIEGGLGKGVYLIAATSRPDLIDPAVLRPGRLDKHLFFPMPNQEERLEIMKALSTDVKYSESDGKILWDEIGRETEGFTGADVHSLLCTAQLVAIRESLQFAEMFENSSSSSSVITPETMNDQREQETQEPICVTQRHIKQALTTFKPSLQKAEFIKFQNIYANFSSTAKGTLDTPSNFLAEREKRATLA